METIQVFAQHPNTDRRGSRFAIYGDRQLAKTEAEWVTPAMYSDWSKRSGFIGIAEVWKTKDLPALGLQGLVQYYDRGEEWDKTWETMDLQTNANEYTAELAAILRALQILKIQSSRYTRQVTILTDCQTAIQSIQKPRLQSGQFLLQQIWRTAKQHIGITGIR
jgi:hypothetical protein